MGKELFLQDLLNIAQRAIRFYLSLPRRKRRKRKYWEAYKNLVHVEMAIKKVMNKEIMARYAGEEPKMEICEFVERGKKR